MGALRGGTSAFFVGDRATTRVAPTNFGAQIDSPSRQSLYFPRIQEVAFNAQTNLPAEEPTPRPRAWLPVQNENEVGPKRPEAQDVQGPPQADGVERVAAPRRAPAKVRRLPSGAARRALLGGWDAGSERPRQRLRCFALRIHGQQAHRQRRRPQPDPPPPQGGDGGDRNRRRLGPCVHSPTASGGRGLLDAEAVVAATGQTRRANARESAPESKKPERRLMRNAALATIRLYQQAVSPYLPPACRYSPSCSGYAYEAITRYGLLKGCWLAVKRLGRCQPFGSSGYDPVP